METLRLALPRSLGQTMITINALSRIQMRDVYAALRRHATGDSNRRRPEAARINGRSLLEGCRVLSVQHDSTGAQFWIITEAGLSRSTIMLPEDF